jgi:hypothetical protein
MSDKKKKNPNAVALGRLGAKARQEKVPPELRRAIARKQFVLGGRSKGKRKRQSS